jgi:hypothetical protein
MSNLSFKDALDQPTDVAVIEPQKNEVAIPHNSQPPVDGVEGEIDAGDLRLPRISLVHPLSELAKAGRPDLIGSYLLNKEVVLGSAKAPFSITALKLKKQYQQELPFGTEESPLVFNTAQEVKDAGGSLTWGSDNYFSEMLHALVVVEAPASVTEDELILFPYEFGEHHYATAMWTLAKSAYNAAGKILITAAFHHLRNGLHEGKWLVGVETKTKGKNSWFVPTLKAAGKHSPELAEFMASLKPNA